MRRIGRDQATSPEALLVSELGTIERVIGFVAARRHLRPSDAEEFASHVKMKLVENDYAILRKFEGRSSLRTYLTVVIQRMLLDYRAAVWGKWRPSAKAQRAGEIGILLEQLMSRDGHGFDEACEILITNYQIDADRERLERIAALLPARSGRQFESDAALVDHAADSPTAAILVERGERVRVAERVSSALRRIIARAEPQDRLTLALRYIDGRTVPDIASMLRIDQKRLYRRLEDLLREIRDGLEAEGIAATDALALLDDPAISIDWSDRESDAPATVVVAKERSCDRA
jgi:RNA polymerase sigma factor for flagellar operon FliA